MVKKRSFSIAVAAVAAMMLFGCSKGYESQKTVDDLKITLSVQRYPLVKGDNSLNISVEDSAGKAVTDAAVNVHYHMPPMPGMAPMDFNAQAVPQRGGFFCSANVPMEGGWKAEVSVVRPGKPAVVATFNLDAR